MRRGKREALQPRAKKDYSSSILSVRMRCALGWLNLPGLMSFSMICFRATEIKCETKSSQIRYDKKCRDKTTNERTMPPLERFIIRLSAEQHTIRLPLISMPADKKLRRLYRRRKRKTEREWSIKNLLPSVFLSRIAPTHKKWLVKSKMCHGLARWWREESMITRLSSRFSFMNPTTSSYSGLICCRGRSRRASHHSSFRCSCDECGRSATCCRACAIRASPPTGECERGLACKMDWWAHSICTKIRSSLINVLRQSNVGNAGRFIAQQVNVRIEDGRVDGLAVLSQYCKLQLKIVNWGTSRSIR